ncbi:MAG TPA: tripartite tricarboxylate transporter substrate-binding protein [Xanthobacteraceae bacterium]|nr:tripartite tricarboxylate transporter substrate-binding protein [Xanthobacteraceae bacterium]
MRLISIVTGALLTAAVCTHAVAQEKQPIRLVVGVVAGGSIDFLARQLADKMKDSLGEQVVVENRGGAGGRLAVNEVKNSKPDGRTIYVNTSGPFVVLPNIYGDKLDYDPVKDFTPLGRLVRFDLAFTTGPATGATNISEAITWAKANPSRAAYGTPGPGTTSHFIGVMIAKAVGVPFTHVPYKGGTPALNDLMGGHVAFVVNSFADTVELHKAGKLRILADTGPKRSQLAPEIPTLRESGINVAADVAIDAYGPAGLSPDTVKRLHSALMQAINSPDVRERLVRYGLFPSPSSPEELVKFQADELKLWAEPIRDSGFKGE